MPPDETTTTTTEQTPDDVFAAAFAQLSSADAAANAPAPTPEPNANAQPQRTEAERATSEAQRDAVTFAKAGPTGPSGDGGGSTEAATSPGTTGPSGVTGTTGEGLPPDDKAKEEAAKAEAARAAAEASLQHQQQPKPDPIERLADLITQRQTTEEPQRQQRQETLDPLYMFNADEKKFLADYEKEYPDIARAEFMRRRIEYAQLTSWMFQQINAAFAPKFEQLDMIATRTHAGDLQQQVPVYNNEVRDKVIDWATKQPMYKRVAYEHVIRQGTVDEVADLISTFQKETGYTPAPKPQAQTQAPDPTKTAQDAAKAAEDARKAAAAAKLAPVKSGNAQRAVSVVAPNDFDGGFDWAVRALANI